MNRRIVSAIIVALVGLSCHSAAPVQKSTVPMQDRPAPEPPVLVQDSEKDQWRFTGVCKVETYGKGGTGLWKFSYEVRSGETTHMVEVDNAMSLSDAIKLRTALKASYMHHMFEGKLTKDTKIDGWSWAH